METSSLHEAQRLPSPGRDRRCERIGRALSRDAGSKQSTTRPAKNEKKTDVARPALKRFGPHSKNQPGIPHRLRYSVRRRRAPGNVRSKYGKPAARHSRRSCVRRSADSPGRNRASKIARLKPARSSWISFRHGMLLQADILVVILIHKSRLRARKDQHEPHG